MNGNYALLTSLAPEQECVALRPSSAPLPVSRRFERVAIACPRAWAEASEGQLVEGRAVGVLRIAGAVLVDELVLDHLGRFRKPPLEVEPLLKFVEREKSADELALAIGIWTSLTPLLTQRDVELAVERGAPSVLLERWRAPFLDDEQLVFVAGAPDPVCEVRAELRRSWLDTEVICPGWRAAPFSLF